MKREMMDKRGLSTVVTTVIMVLLVIVAVGIVWVVIKNVITDSSEQIDTGNLLINLEITSVADGSGQVLVTVRRGTGAGDLTDVAIIASDGSNSYVAIKPTTLAELATETFTVTTADFVGAPGGFAITEISVAPVTTTASGDKNTAQVSFNIKNDTIWDL